MTSNKNDRRYSNYTAGSYVSILPISDQKTLNLVSSVINISENFIKIDKSYNYEIYSKIIENYPHFTKFIEKKFLYQQEIYEFFIDFTGVLKKSQINNIKSLLEKKIKNENLLDSYEILFSNYSQLILKNKICLLDLLNSLYNEKQKLELSITEIFEFFPIKYPKNYSLISNPISDENNLEIVFTLVREKIQRKFYNNDKKRLKQAIFEEKIIEYFGQCTNYLNSIEQNDKLIITDIKNDFIFPMDCLINNNKPIVYFCNGTGITPFISFLKEFNFSVGKMEKSTMNKISNLAIFTGFRNANQDKKETIYEDFIINKIDSLNEQIGNNSIIYKRCLSNDEGKNKYKF